MTDPGKIPNELRYTSEHEWFRAENDEVVVGITDYAQQQLTDVVFVGLPAVGKSVAEHATVLTLESVKTVSDVYAPVAGSVSAVNDQLKAHPEYVNQDPYAKGWLFRLKPASPLAGAEGLSAEQYRAQLDAAP